MLTTHPAQGTIVRVDLSQGFQPPEMGKRRPAIVLSREIPGRPLMCAIVPLSTSAPRPPLAHHMRITFVPPLPAPYSSATAWVKGDIVLTVGFHRLRYLFSGQPGGHKRYDIRVLDPVTFARGQECVRCGLSL